MSRNPYRMTTDPRRVLDALRWWRVTHAPMAALRLRWAARAACRRLRGERDEARAEVETWKDRCESSFEDVESLNKLNEMWHGRSTRAEAAIERVRAVLSDKPTLLYHPDDLLRALDGAP